MSMGSLHNEDGSFVCVLFFVFFRFSFFVLFFILCSDWEICPGSGQILNVQLPL